MVATVLVTAAALAVATEKGLRHVRTIKSAKTDAAILAAAALVLALVSIKVGNGYAKAAMLGIAFGLVGGALARTAPNLG